MFLEILTRTFGQRPGMLARNQASLAALTDPDWTQTLLYDADRQGIGWSTENMAAYAPQLDGEYVWILDDDDLCVRPTLIAELRTLVAEQDPDLIMLRMDHGERGILPDAAHWGVPPVRAAIGVSAFVARRALWQACAPALLPGHYESDFELAAALYARAQRVCWHDVIASRVQWIGLGRAEWGNG